MIQSVRKILGFEPAWDPIPEAEQAPWPPRSYIREHDVSMGRQTWKSVSLLYKVDVDDLIYFNFRTSNKRWVNWYLHHYVGCWQSQDRRNFDFEGAMPGKIFIPPSDYRRQEGQLTDQAAQALAAAAKLYPWLLWLERGLVVKGVDLAGIARKLSARKIRLIADDDVLKAFHSHAMYSNQSMATFFGFKGTAIFFVKSKFSFRDVFDLHNLIHEATHAILYEKGYNTITVEEEVMCRVAAELWHYRKSTSTFDAWYKQGRTKEQWVLAQHLAETEDEQKVIDVFDRPMPYFEWTFGNHHHKTHAFRNPVEELKKRIRGLYPSTRPAGVLSQDPRVRYYIENKESD